MKKFVPYAAVLLMAVAGCQKPDPLVVDTGETAERSLEVSTLLLPDTTSGISSVDSSGIIPRDAVSFSGLVLVNSVKHDAGSNGMYSETSSIVYFADRTHPILFNGKLVGYYGMDLTPNILRPVTVNSLAMLRIPYRLRIASAVLDSSFGYMYVRDLSTSYQPKSVITWDAPSPLSINSFSVQITTPDNVQVLAPAGGSVISRNAELVLRWMGKGNIDIIISVMNPISKKTRPVLKLHPLLNTGRAVIDPRIFQMLPRDRYFVFTFILANRYEKLAVGQYTGAILVQAASIYNSYVELQ